MSNVYYAPGEDRPRKVHDLFSRIAGRYDFINDVQSFGLHRWWKRRLLREAALHPGSRALDLCCGTGDVAFLLAQSAGEVVGLDFNSAMLEVAAKRRTRLPQSIASRVRFIQGDALQPPFEPATFDAVTVSYGLRNLASIEASIHAIQRVLRPGGRVLILDFGKPENAVWRRIYFGYLRQVVPLWGRAFCGDADAYAYILESLHHYPAQHGVDQALKQAGFTQTRILRFLGGMMSLNIATHPLHPQESTSALDSAPRRDSLPPMNHTPPAGHPRG